MRFALGIFVGYFVSIIGGIALSMTGVPLLATYLALFAGAYAGGYIGRRQGYLVGLIIGFCVALFASIMLAASSIAGHASHGLSLQRILSLAIGSTIIGTTAGWLGSSLHEAIKVIKEKRIVESDTTHTQ